MCPEVAKEWDTEKNGVRLPSQISYRSSAKAWWKCTNHGHSYQAGISHRTSRNQGCPYCSGRRVLPGFNDLATLRPDLASEWSSDNKLGPHQVTIGSHYEALWVCKNHEKQYKKAVKERTLQRTGCPYCHRTKVLPGFNDLATTHADLVSEWSDENDDSPTEYLSGSQHKAVWKCRMCGHSWSASIASRANGAGCPECAKTAISVARRTPKSGRSLAEMCPSLMNEWDYGKNTLDPRRVKYRSNETASWVCSTCGNRWDAVIASRAVGHGCPRCASKQNGLSKSFAKEGSSLADMCPEIADEFNSTKNGMRAGDITYGSNRVMWWKCGNCGHEWKSSVHHRAAGAGCPACFRRSRSSFPEKALFYYVSQAFPDAESNATPPVEGIGNMEFDIWIPSIRTAVEYDGEYWHSRDVKAVRDAKKDSLCFINSIRMIRVQEPMCAKYNVPLTTSVIMRSDNFGHDSLDNTVLDLLNELGTSDNITVDTRRDARHIRKLLGSNGESSSLAAKRPDISEMWDYAKNDGLTPHDVGVRCKDEVWWTCDKGHSFKRSVDRQCRSGMCPECTKASESARKMRPAIGSSFGDIYPRMASEWVRPVDDKYMDLTAFDVRPRSNIRVIWKCNTCGREWSTSIGTRTNKSREDKYGCRSCRMKALHANEDAA